MELLDVLQPETHPVSWKFAIALGDPFGSSAAKEVPTLGLDQRRREHTIEHQSRRLWR